MNNNYTNSYEGESGALGCLAGAFVVAVIVSNIWVVWAWLV